MMARITAAVPRMAGSTHQKSASTHHLYNLFLTAYPGSREASRVILEQR
nr:MAG TPA: hypothetical protein [Caudoviricetes sp.]